MTIMNKLRKSLVLLAVLLGTVALWGANTQQSVQQVTTAVTLTADVDYIVTSSTPFTDQGVVNIQNTDHAVLILAGVKPSAALSLLSEHVQIDGARAVNNSNCQVKLYNHGCIILPYGSNTKPLTVYSERDFQGEAVNDFGLENDGGYMNTLTDRQLNNRIRSFRLKRGYMVTFSLKAGGRGYSRCFIAADADLEVAELPAILDRSISSYRVFKWYDAGKAQLANCMDKTVLGALNVQSSYDWAQGNESFLPDYEWVPNHIYEDWPSSSTIGRTTQSPHCKNNNEPLNKTDDRPQDLNTILNNWENMMRTGLRLCSPSSWDGSDYVSNASGFLRQFLDSIDARGWRCDIIDLHCYWAEGSFNSIGNWTNACHRPIWISEWCWGASWNDNGAFASGVTESQVRDALERICSKLNGLDYVERYYYWNNERDPSRLYRNGQLSPAGQMYAKLDGGLAYKGTVGYVPAVPRQQAPANLAISFNHKTQKAELSWDEYNGEMNEYARLECKKSDTDTWTTVCELPMTEETGRLTTDSVEAQLGWQFRIVEKVGDGKLYASNTVMAASSSLGTGDAIGVGGKTMYLGGNLAFNGTFALGLCGWTNGQGQPLAQPWFKAVGGVGDGTAAFLQSCGHGGTDSERSVFTVFDLQPNTYYYFSADSRNVSSSTLARYCQLALSNDGKSLDKTVINIDNTSANWATKFIIFNSGEYSKAILSLAMLQAKSQFDNIKLFPLFNSEEQAQNHGAQLEVEQDPMGTEGMEIMAVRIRPRVQQLAKQARNFINHFRLPGHEQLEIILSTVEKDIDTTPALKVVAYDAVLRSAVARYLPMTVAEGLVTSPDFKTVNGWQTKAGTYKGGDQRTNTLGGQSFWNAWWNLTPAEAEGQTMAVRQTVNDLEHGLYAVECQATTQHYCLSDQHAYIVSGTDSVPTLPMQSDYMDIPCIDDSQRWETLTSLPVYVDEGGSVTIGFESSKQGAQDLAWRELGKLNSAGDHREGWWGVTNFRLRRMPLYRINTTAGQWGVACLPYAVKPSDGLTFYQIIGITPDYQRLCLEPLSEVEAGMPFVYLPTQQQHLFQEYGERAAKPADASCNLIGYFTTNNLKVRQGYYALIDGVWKKITDSRDRPYVGNFTAVMRAIDEKHLMPVIADWTGTTMPIEGVTEEEIAAGITLHPSSSDLHPSSSTVYTLGGTPATGTSQPGIYIRQQGDKVQKTVIK